MSLCEEQCKEHKSHLSRAAARQRGDHHEGTAHTAVPSSRPRGRTQVCRSEPNSQRRAVHLPSPDAQGGRKVLYFRCDRSLNHGDRCDRLGRSPSDKTPGSVIAARRRSQGPVSRCVRGDKHVNMQTEVTRHPAFQDTSPISKWLSMDLEATLYDLGRQSRH